MNNVRKEELAAEAVQLLEAMKGAPDGWERLAISRALLRLVEVLDTQEDEARFSGTTLAVWKDLDIEAKRALVLKVLLQGLSVTQCKIALLRFKNHWSAGKIARVLKIKRQKLASEGQRFKERLFPGMAIED